MGTTLLALACQNAPMSPVPPSRSDPCGDLAYVFMLVAENRDRGQSREEQIEALGESVHSPFVGRPDQTLRTLTRVVDAVYAAPRASPAEIEDSILRQCRVDAQGRVVLAAPAAETAPVGSSGPALSDGGVADAGSLEAPARP